MYPTPAPGITFCFICPVGEIGVKHHPGNCKWPIWIHTSSLIAPGIFESGSSCLLFSKEQRIAYSIIRPHACTGIRHKSDSHTEMIPSFKNKICILLTENHRGSCCQ